MPEGNEQRNKTPWLVKVDWPAPRSIQAFCTTRITSETHQQVMNAASIHGVSTAATHCYQGFNLGDHVGDQIEQVQQNRDLLSSTLGVSEPQWLKQVHSSEVVELSKTVPDPLTVYEADAAMTGDSKTVCAVLTADCLPVLVCDKHGSQVAAIHAGWRGLSNGIIRKTIAKFSSGTSDILCWLGPAIGPAAFEVGSDVYAAFSHLRHVEQGFKKHPYAEGKWYADIYQLAKLELQSIGVQNIFGGDFCTYRQSQAFYSYRREGQTGRMASLIWRE